MNVCKDCKERCYWFYQRDEVKDDRNLYCFCNYKKRLKSEPFTPTKNTGTETKNNID